MASYNFKLQNILDLKLRKEENSKNEFGKALKRLQIEKEKKDLLTLSLETVKNELNVKAETGISVDNLKLLLQNISFYKECIKRQCLAIKMAGEYVEVCRTELVRATQEKKAMEKLKEKDYTTYLYIEQKKEEKLVDELVSFKQSNR